MYSITHVVIYILFYLLFKGFEEVDKGGCHILQNSIDL